MKLSPPIAFTCNSYASAVDLPIAMIFSASAKPVLLIFSASALAFSLVDSACAAALALVEQDVRDRVHGRAGTEEVVKKKNVPSARLARIDLVGRDRQCAFCVPRDR